MLASKLLGVCVRYTKNREEAEDCLQEAFIKIFQNITTYKNEGSFEGWARKITVNILLDFLKSRKSFQNSFDVQDVENYIPDKSETHGNLLKQDVVSIINMLPDGKKTIFNLYAVEGFSHKEIAEMLKISEGTSKSQLSKAKEMLIELHKKHNAIANVAS